MVNAQNSQNIYHMVLQHGSKGINQLMSMSGNQPYTVQRLDLAHHGVEARSQQGTAKAGALFLGTTSDQAGLNQGYLERKKAQHIHTHCLNGVASQSMTYSQYHATSAELGHQGPKTLAQAGYTDQDRRSTRNPQPKVVHSELSSWGQFGQARNGEDSSAFVIHAGSSHSNQLKTQSLTGASESQIRTALPHQSHSITSPEGPGYPAHTFPLRGGRSAVLGANASTQHTSEYAKHETAAAMAGQGSPNRNAYMLGAHAPKSGYKKQRNALGSTSRAAMSTNQAQLGGEPALPRNSRTAARNSLLKTPEHFSLKTGSPLKPTSSKMRSYYKQYGSKQPIPDFIKRKKH